MSTTPTLAKYDEARRALAEACRVDEVKNIRDKAMAMQVYAKQPKDGDLIALTTEIRKRAERCLGELMAEERKAGRLATGKEGTRKALGSPKDPRDRPSLAEQGVGKALADRARKAAAMPEEKFEAHVAHAVKVAVAATEGDREIVKAARGEQQAKKRAHRQERERELGAKIAALPEKKYGVIYPDPPWKFEAYNGATGYDRAAANHYTTMDSAAICKLEIPAAFDAVLFLWATVPMLPQALQVMDVWGFNYKSAIAWIKDKAGTGYWAGNRLELLLIGTRGHAPAPAQGEQPPQVIEAPRGRHSAPMFARAPRAGWSVHGNEVERAVHVNKVEHATGKVKARAGDNDDDPQDLADARKATYAAVDESAADPHKEGIPAFLQTQNRGAA
jgi:N6-adenosine-specific RNA methylase IME4